jgi:maltose alpha-D-glucosyltransferase/alpha-amylase
VIDLWYKNAVLYCLDVGTFADGNGDGIGDLRGLADRLPYLAGIGVTCIWLLPFYPSPRRDDGYDIQDYDNVDPRYGTLGDFVDFMRQADEFGIRVIVDLVVNHTSDAHPWFQAARTDPKSSYRDWYVWFERRLGSLRRYVRLVSLMMFVGLITFATCQWPTYREEDSSSSLTSWLFWAQQRYSSRA